MDRAARRRNDYPPACGATEVADDFLPCHPTTGGLRALLAAYDPVETEERPLPPSGQNLDNLETERWLARMGHDPQTSRSCRRRKEIPDGGGPRPQDADVSHSLDVAGGVHAAACAGVPQAREVRRALKASLDRDVIGGLLQTLEHLLDHRLASSWCTRRRPSSRDGRGGEVEGRIDAVEGATLRVRVGRRLF